MNPLYLEMLPKQELSITADMSNIKLEKTLKKDKIFDILNKCYDEVYSESPFKSISLDIRSILPKKGCKEIKEYLKYVEEKKELTSLEIKTFKNVLIKKKMT